MPVAACMGMGTTFGRALAGLRLHHHFLHHLRDRPVVLRLAGLDHEHLVDVLHQRGPVRDHDDGHGP